MRNILILSKHFSEKVRLNIHEIHALRFNNIKLTFLPILDEHDTKAKNVTISKGEHAFQFRFQLPEGGEEGKDLPTSLEGAYGYVR